MRSAISPSELNKRLSARGIAGGVELGRWYPELEDCLLISVTETRTREQLDGFVAALKEAL
jgi:glycine dehydrogenase subunit 1